MGLTVFTKWGNFNNISFQSGANAVISKRGITHVTVLKVLFLLKWDKHNIFENFGTYCKHTTSFTKLKTGSLHLWNDCYPQFLETVQKLITFPNQNKMQVIRLCLLHWNGYGFHVDYLKRCFILKPLKFARYFIYINSKLSETLRQRTSAFKPVITSLKGIWL